MKRCGDCKFLKPYDEFHRRKDSYQSVCKLCRKLRDTNRAYSAEALAKKEQRRVELIEWARSLKDAPCIDCHQRYHFAAMQWDHIGDDKSFGLSWAVTRGFSKKKILAEIAKCELVCANCHAIRTYNRAHGI